MAKKFLDQDGTQRLAGEIMNWVRGAGGATFTNVDLSTTPGSVQTQSAPQGYEVTFFAQAGVFLAVAGGKYYPSWGQMEQLSCGIMQADGIHPFPNKLYYATGSKKMYRSGRGTDGKMTLTEVPVGQNWSPGANIELSGSTIDVPLATASKAGVVSVGSGLSVTGGKVSANTASTSQAGIVKVKADSGIDVSSGEISVSVMAASDVTSLVNQTVSELIG